MKPVIFYGQNREDLILDAFFADKEEGFYVDIGAYDPVFESVTKLFYDKGWHGINIEPQTEFFKGLKRQRKRDINVQMGVADKPGKLTLRSYAASGLSTFSSTIKGDYKKSEESETQKFKDYEVAVDTLASVLSKHKVKSIDFLKVDVEGLEYEVLAGNDWRRFRPEVICIEANHIVRDWRPLLKKKDYTLAFFDGLNEYYVANEALKRIDVFKKSYPEKLVAAPTLSFGWSVQIKQLQKQLKHVQNALDQQTKYNRGLEEQLSLAHEELQKHESPRFLAKKLANRTLHKPRAKHKS